MPGHYVRVQEAAALLEVAPPTVRWYCSQGMLPTYWIGRGNTGHRRFRYSDIESLGVQLGRPVPPEQEWDREEAWNVRAIAEYLGLSTKFLLDSGVIQSGVELTWEELQDLEQKIYGSQTDPQDHAEDENDEEDPEMRGLHHEHDDHHGRRGHHHGPEEHEHGPGKGKHRPGHGPDGHGHHPMHGQGFRPGGGFGRSNPWGPKAPWLISRIDPTDLLTMRSVRRHLEAQKADLEDQIAELTRRIEAHPDSTAPADDADHPESETE